MLLLPVPLSSPVREENALCILPVTALLYPENLAPEANLLLGLAAGQDARATEVAGESSSGRGLAGFQFALAAATPRALTRLCGWHSIFWGRQSGCLASRIL